jgi:hypothetical protein
MAALADAAAELDKGGGDVGRGARVVGLRQEAGSRRRAPTYLPGALDPGATSPASPGGDYAQPGGIPQEKVEYLRKRLEEERQKRQARTVLPVPGGQPEKAASSLDRPVGPEAQAGRHGRAAGTGWPRTSSHRLPEPQPRSQDSAMEAPASHGARAIATDMSDGVIRRQTLSHREAGAGRFFAKPPARHRPGRSRAPTMKRPGAIVKEGLKAMSQYLPRYIGGVEMGPCEARCQQYLATVLEPNTSMSVRSKRELKTIAVAIDLLCDGHTLAAVDVLMSRFQAIEVDSYGEGGCSAGSRSPPSRPRRVEVGTAEAGDVAARQLGTRDRKQAGRGCHGEVVRQQWPPAEASARFQSGEGGRSPRPDEGCPQGQREGPDLREGGREDGRARGWSGRA